MKNVLMAVAALAAGGTASAGVYITEYEYAATNGGTQANFEWVELTNLGASPVDFTGWSFDDDTRTAGSFSLTGLGIVAPGESVVITEATATAFRARWNLSASVKVLGGNTNNLGRDDEINIYDSTNTLADRLTYGDDLNVPGTIRTNLKSGWAYRTDGSSPYGNIDSAWKLSTVADAQSSVTAVAPGTDVGSPGRYTAPTPGSVTLLLAAGLVGRRRRA